MESDKEIEISKCNECKCMTHNIIRDNFIICGKCEKNKISEMRMTPCYMCGVVDEEGCFIVGFDHSDMEDILYKHYKKGTVLCEECLFK